MKKLFALILFLSILQFGCQKECSENQKCDLKPETGSCKAAFTKYYYDKKTGKCKEFIWGGCGGVVPFDSLEECQECECRN